MNVTSVEVTDDRVIIRRGGVNPQVIGLTFAEVASASDALRAFLLPLVPVEVPLVTACKACMPGAWGAYHPNCPNCRGTGRVVTP